MGKIKPKEFKTERAYLKWLNSEGFVEIGVTCAKCGKKFTDIIEKVRKKDALKGDTFFCLKCSKKMV